MGLENYFALLYIAWDVHQYPTRVRLGQLTKNVFELDSGHKKLTDFELYIR